MESRMTSVIVFDVQHQLGPDSGLAYTEKWLFFTASGLNAVIHIFLSGCKLSIKDFFLSPKGSEIGHHSPLLS